MAYLDIMTCLRIWHISILQLLSWISICSVIALLSVIVVRNFIFREVKVRSYWFYERVSLKLVWLRTFIAHILTALQWIEDHMSMWHIVQRVKMVKMDHLLSCLCRYSLNSSDVKLERNCSYICYGHIYGNYPILDFVAWCKHGARRKVLKVFKILDCLSIPFFFFLTFWATYESMKLVVFVCLAHRPS